MYMIAYDMEDIAQSDLHAQQEACDLYFENIIKAKNSVILGPAGHTSFKKYLLNMNSRQDYKTILEVMKDPDYFFENPVIFRFILTKYRRSI